MVCFVATQVLIKRKNLLSGNLFEIVLIQMVLDLFIAISHLDPTKLNHRTFYCSTKLFMIR